MKPILLLCTLAFSSFVQCQSPSTRGEFADQPNGLMYSDGDIKVLRHLVDSLNLRFKTCDLNQVYYSAPQTRLYSVTFSSKSDDLLDIKKAIDANTSFNEVTRKFASYVTSLDTTELFICYTDTSERGPVCLEGSPGNGYSRVYSFKLDPAKILHQWDYTYNKKGEYSKEYSISCRYFPSTLHQQAIPEPYARLIQYVDCMIDTNSQVMLAKEWPDRFDSKISEQMTSINNYVSKKMGKKPLKNPEYSWQLPTEEQVDFAIKNLKQDLTFIALLNKVADDCIEKNYGNVLWEYLVENCISKEKSLLMKRSRLVVGQCSQDMSPRMHAREIALLAAETHHWDIFLRAHMDIMNDRFERMTDGSYAWDSRKTYLKELEELNLNVVDLMLGMTFRADNVSSNHYYSTVWRTGWALTESREKDRFEEIAFRAMKDQQLDEFNRGLIFLLYKSYLMRLPNDKEIAEKIGQLKRSANEFPDFIRPHIHLLKPPDKRE